MVDKKIHLPHLLKNIVLFLLPTALWISVCIMKNGRYHNEEIEVYRQLVWIVDTLRISAGAFFSASMQNLQLFIATFREMGLFLLITLGFAGHALAKNNTDYKKALPILSAIFLVYLGFYMALGFYQTRLTFTLFPICIVSIFVAVSGSKSLNKNAVVYLLLALGWHIYNVVSYGPFT
jgi:hypothetical protein